VPSWTAPRRRLGHGRARPPPGRPRPAGHRQAVLRWSMGGRSKPPWAVFVGGPLDGKRELLQPNDLTRTTMVRQSAEYQVTSEYRIVKQDIWKVRSRILRFVRTLPEAT